MSDADLTERARELLSHLSYAVSELPHVIKAEREAAEERLEIEAGEAYERGVQSGMKLCEAAAAEPHTLPVDDAAWASSYVAIVENKDRDGIFAEFRSAFGNYLYWKGRCERRSKERDEARAAAAEARRAAIEALRSCPSLDENGYICTKDAAIRAILASLPVADAIVTVHALARHLTAEHADEYTDEELTELAEEIQTAVEDWFRCRKASREMP